MAETNKPDTIVPTEAQKKAQRKRSIAIGIVLALFVVIVYVGGLAKMGASLSHGAL